MCLASPWFPPRKISAVCAWGCVLVMKNIDEDGRTEEGSTLIISGIFPTPVGTLSFLAASLEGYLWTGS